ncbi:DNA topoisomerase 1 [Geodia barretti]|uniref:DNA topoisomerase n=1 Tax=Geodia barretti TaxID=519541 RepID=A0AA35WN82_GEOBA|nr:DNA topoisomerase 1 [Geodia barretti]
MALVDAQQARRVLDRLVGYQISPILWRSVKPGLSAGRVQSVAVRLICEREAEIEAFKSEEYWTLTATLTPTEVQHLFPAKLHRIGKKKGEINNYGFRIDEARAKELAADAKTQAYLVEKVQKRERKQKPVPPFITSTLQQEASRKLRFVAKRTMFIAQQLYEGLEIGSEGSIGLITYMRTDSTRVAQEALQAARAYIKTTFGEEYLPNRAVNYQTKKGAQDAHEAIRPTLPLQSPADLKPYLSNDQFRLYELIWMRFIASQMNPAIFDGTTIDIQAGTYLFRSTGSVMKFQGFRRVYMEDERESDGEDVNLPDVKEGDTLNLRKLEPKQHFTQPPPRYNEATLVKMLEAKEIGRPSTYASILSTIQDRGYVTKERGRLLPTDVGRLVNELLKHGFPNIVDVEFTAKMEDQLDVIADGKVKWVETLGQFYPAFQTALKEAPDRMYEARKAMEEQSDEKCEKCGTNMIIKWGRYGRFLGCANYPECQNIKRLTSAVGIDCPEPDCDGYLGERRSRRGKVFYGCSNYPKCEFSTWDKPVPEPCPKCNAPFLVEKTEKAKGSEVVTTRLACRTSECDYTK